MQIQQIVFRSAVRRRLDEFDAIFQIRSNRRLVLSNSDEVGIRATVDIVSTALACDVEFSAVRSHAANMSDVLMRVVVSARFSDASYLACHFQVPYGKAGP